MYAAALFFANTLNYLLALLLFVAAWREARRQNLWRFLPASALGIGLACGIAEWGKRLPVWSGHPGFPSGHETFALSAATCLVYANRRWLAAVLPLAAVMAWALVVAHFHTPADVLGAWLVGPPVALLCQRRLNAPPRIASR